MGTQHNIRTFSEIAQEIGQVWKNINPYALETLNAMKHLRTNNPNEQYYFDDARTIVNYFLARATGWRGDDAKRIKNELKQMLK